MIASGRGGAGYPLVHVPTIRGSILRFFEGDRIVPAATQFEGFEDITYDRRGTRLSERNVPNELVDLYLDDLQAVVDGMRLDRFAVNASFVGVPEAVAFAARNGERVSSSPMHACRLRSGKRSRR